MFCSNCGAKLNEGSKFCINCGAKLGSESKTEVVKEKQFDKRLFIMDLEMALPHLQEIESAISRRANAQTMKKKCGKNDKLIAFVIAVVVGGFLSFIGQFFGAYLQYTGKIQNISILEAAGLFGAGLFVILFAVVFNISRSNFRSKEKKKINMYNKLINDNQEIINRNAGVINPILSKHLPGDYWYVLAVSKMVSYIKNGRADDVKEAINLFEEEMSRMRIENMQAAILYENQKQTNYAALTMVSAAIAEMNSYR